MGDRSLRPGPRAIGVFYLDENLLCLLWHTCVLAPIEAPSYTDGLYTYHDRCAQELIYGRLQGRTSVLMYRPSSSSMFSTASLQDLTANRIVADSVPLPFTFAPASCPSQLQTFSSPDARPPSFATGLCCGTRVVQLRLKATCIAPCLEVCT